MEFKDKEGKKAWDQMVKVNSKDFYSNGVVKYARRWAKYMQTLIAEGNTVDEIAEKHLMIATLKVLQVLCMDMQSMSYLCLGSTAKNSETGTIRSMAIQEMALSILQC